VTTDFGAELANSGGSWEVPPNTDGATTTAAAESASGVGADSVDTKPAIGVTTDFGVAPAAQTSVSPTSASTCAVHRDAIDLGLSRGRNAMAIWQDLARVS
jgi:hypothetical protein